MTLQKFIAAATIIAGLAASPVQAARMYLTFGTPGTPAVGPGDADLPPVPSTDVHVGDLVDINFWYRPGNVGTQDPALQENYTTVAWSLANSHTEILTATGNTVTNVDGRWTGTAVNAGILNTAAVTGHVGEDFLVSNARGGVVGAGDGIGNMPQHIGAGADSRYDAASGSFHLGTLTVRADVLGSSNLFLRVGANRIAVKNGNGTTVVGQVFMGNSNVSYPTNGTGSPGDDIANAALADGVINVVPIINPVTRELVERPILAENLPADITHPGAGEGQPGTEIVNDVIGAAKTDIAYLNYHGQGPLNDSYAVYVDVRIEQGSPSTVASIIAQINTEMSNGLRTEGGTAIALPGSNELLNGIDYDFLVTFPHGPADGAESIDIDFSSLPGVSIANVAIPEPSTMALTAMGLIGVVLAARRRRAA